VTKEVMFWGLSSLSVREILIATKIKGIKLKVSWTISKLSQKLSKSVHSWLNLIS